ncbi:thiolase family protein [Marininema halotolerans]|uniref:acetyl-CoA C-acyltransferase n=1 Tax=Marininema halotolerans TaxID=1155944 RepID=A0A1I6UJT8_9BACL|nr:thiolase family protein [Marininema halotolerans]SFT01693.1 acetyl-CoA C-acetyltransferase [Marininema halotolerans]
MREAVILDAVRTPIGRYRGVLAGVRPDDLAAGVIRALLKRNSRVDPDRIEDVVLGCVNQAGEDNRNVARMAGLLAGLPVEVAGVTVNRLCASGLEAIHQATASLLMGNGDFFIAGGVESMSRAPLVMMKPEGGLSRGDHTLVDSTLGWRFINPRLAAIHYPYSMGETAENVAEKYGVSREEQDSFALMSQHRAGSAWKEKRFVEEIVPVSYVPKKGAPVLIQKDEHLRPDTTLEKLSSLTPSFRKEGTVTAGNASGINDGAAALLIGERKQAEAAGMEPMARIHAVAVSGCDPAYMGIGPVLAVRKLLARTGLSIRDIDLVELNEAFAAQAIACMKELDFEPEKVNVNGGAIAFGHPLGASGARIMTTLLYELQRQKRRWGLATMCVGVGQGMAVLVENLRR